jgi:hypothetical protein
MHIWTHASTPGTTARQRPRKELMQTQEALQVSFVRRNQSHLAPPMLGLHCTHFLRHQYPSTPQPLFPTYPRTVRGPRILGGRDFTVPHWSTQQSAPLWRSSAQLHNGPLRGCRKIGRKAAVQQSRSRRARRNPSPRMTKVTVHEKREVNEKRPNPRNSPSHNHDNAAPRQHPLICTGAGPIHLVHGQPMSLATKAIPRNEGTFSPFSRALLLLIRTAFFEANLFSWLKNLATLNPEKLQGFHGITLYNCYTLRRRSMLNWCLETWGSCLRRGGQGQIPSITWMKIAFIITHKEIM